MARILVTQERSEPLCGLLRARGLDPVHIPLLLLRATGAAPPEQPPAWVLVSSAATLRFAPQLAAHVGGASVVAVGPASARAAQGAGLACDQVGEGGGAEALSALLQSGIDPMGGLLWHVGAAQCAPGLEAALAAWPGPVARWAVYESAPPPGLAAALAEAGPLDVLCFASGAAAVAFARHRAQGDARVAVIGPRTADQARAVGLRVHGVAARPSLLALAATAAALADPAWPVSAPWPG